MKAAQNNETPATLILDPDILSEARAFKLLKICSESANFVVSTDWLVGWEGGGGDVIFA